MVINQDVYRSVLVLEFDIHLDIIAMNSTAMCLLGAKSPRRALDVFDTRTYFDMKDLIQRVDSFSTPVYHVLKLKVPGPKGCIHVIGLVEKLQTSSEKGLRVTALSGPDTPTALETLIYSDEIHKTFVQTSSEAMWCIDFSEPVDLSQGTHEIIRQVFENDCRWLMCNEAMANIYDLPKGMDLNDQPVSLYFPRNQENEVFVQQIINSNFHVENALSVDTAHDGSIMYMENTVRCKIQDGYLLRMWGTVRDVTGYRHVRNRLAREASDARSILNAIPDAILVIDRDRRLLAVNTAFQNLFGWSPYDFFGQDIQEIIDLDTPLPNNRKWYGIGRKRWITDVKTSNGTQVSCHTQSFPISDNATDRFVLTLHPV